MAVALAAVKFAVVAAAFLLAGIAGVGPAEAAVTATISADDYTPGFCGDVVLTASVTGLETVSKYLWLYSVADDNRRTQVAVWSATAAINERTYTVRKCKLDTPNRYQAKASATTSDTSDDTYSEVITVTWQPPRIEISADQFLVGLCEPVELTVDYHTGPGAGAAPSLERVGYVYEVTEEGRDSGLRGRDAFRSESHTTTVTLKHCKPGAHLYHAKVYGKDAGAGNVASGTFWSNLINVEWRHPSGLGPRTALESPDVFTSNAPEITATSVSDAEAGPGEAPGSTVILQWVPLRDMTRYGVQYWPTADPDSAQEVFTTSTSETLAARMSIHIPDLFSPDVAQVSYTFRVKGVFTNDSTVAFTLDTLSGPVVMEPGDSTNTPYSAPSTVVLQPGGSSRPIDTTTAGEASAVAPGEAIEGINEVARFIASQTGMGTGAATAFLPLLCLLLAGGATAMVVWPLGFSPLSLFAGFLVFTLVWSVGGVAWFGLPIAMAVLPPVLLAVCGAMLVKRRGLFG